VWKFTTVLAVHFLSTLVKDDNINGCKTFAASIAQILVDKQVQELKNINILSILSDGSTDISVTEQEIVYIRYVERSVLTSFLRLGE
jgi:hypothetical protein